MPAAPIVRKWWGRVGPEVLLGVVALLGLLGFLGSAELWGRREQRAAAEAVDTVRAGHWLVGEIQGRPRLEKPPLPRWITAGLMTLTGRRDEVIVRLPDALAGLGLVALVLAWGRAVGGREVGLAAGFALASTPFFLVEMRQAGNDALLALFVGFALWGVARRWNWADGLDEDRPGSRRWNLLGALAVGLGFLCKGPVVFLWVGLPIVGFLATRRRLQVGLRLLASSPGLAILAILVVAWPVVVAIRYPAAVGIWTLEIGQKTGSLGVEHGNARGSIVLDALAIGLPWTPLVALALIQPLRQWRNPKLPPTPPALSLAGWWLVGPLAALGIWDVAKPNYLLPALPAAALLAGWGWVTLARRARDWTGGLAARLTLQVGWSGLFAGSIAAPVVARAVAPEWAGLAVGLGLILASAALASAWFWRSGRPAASLGALASGLVGVALAGYGVVAPSENPTRGHRQLAAELDRRLPLDSPTWFFDDLDEGVWFYGPTLDLRAVPSLNDGVAPPSTNRGHALRAGVVTARSPMARSSTATWPRAVWIRVPAA